ncbi:amino acid ABC transporter permease [Dactylosporangium sp. NPDC000521]|uniref:amino acid ABC transporter permease n=1 Tax=Dactylosporangium sp. NPDC000521 TaxID=3363975 RepID=UPI00369725EE
MSGGLVDEAGEHAPRQTVRRRHPWRWVTGALIIAILALVVAGLAGARIDWAGVGIYLRSPIFIQAMWATVVLAVVSQVIAVVLGVVLAVLRISPNPVASSAAAFFIWIFRGVPVLLQILVWYNLALIIPRIAVGIPGTDVMLIDRSTNDVMTPFVAAILGLALNEAAYMAEIVRGGIKSVDAGQIEAAGALGMSPGRTMRRVILPQAMRVIIPPTGNDFINMLKTTSLASVITYPELLRAAQNVSAVNLQVMETLFADAFWYMVIVSITSVLQHFVERRFDATVGRQSGSASLKSIMRSVVRPPFMRGRAPREVTE